MELQWKVIRAQQRGMDMYNGEDLPSSFTRHHYKHNKADCTLHALVGIANRYNAVVDGKTVYKYYEETFEGGKIKIETGRPPRHWSLEKRKEFIARASKQFEDYLQFYLYSPFS